MKSVHVGSEIIIADGNFLLNVKEIIDDKTIMATVLNDASIGSRKNCNLPGAIIDLPAVSEKDKSDIKFAVKNKVRYHGVKKVSFIQHRNLKFTRGKFI